MKYIKPLGRDVLYIVWEDKDAETDDYFKKAGVFINGDVIPLEEIGFDYDLLDVVPKGKYRYIIKNGNIYLEPYNI